MTRGTHSPVEQLPSIGDAVGRYRIVGVLGDGSLGRLYLAEQRGIRGVSSTVVLRCIRPELAQIAQFGAQFSQAASFATRCQHPNVVTVFEMGQVDGRYFISMEYIPAESVTSVLARCSGRHDLSPDIAAYVVRQAAAGAQHLHDQYETSPQRIGPRPDVVDPSHVFVSYHGTVKCLGLGLGSLVGATGSTQAAASSASSAPTSETLSVDADRAAVVTNLGALLLMCLSGERPLLVPGAEGDEVPPNASSAVGRIRPDVPDALEAIVRQALSSSSRERFASPRELADALDRYLSRREERPTPKQLRRSMEQWFGAERAGLQLQIARGRDVEAALTRLQAAAARPESRASHAVRAVAAPRPRPLWSTSHAVFSQLSRASIAPRSFERFVGSPPDDSSQVTTILTRHLPSSFVSASPSLANAELPALAPPDARPSRSWLVSTVLAAGAVLAAGLVVILSFSSPHSALSSAGSESASGAHGGRLDVRSTPEGAAVFVDGEPTGLRTPASLKGLAQGRTLHVRVEKAGFASQERQFSVAGDSAETALFELRASDARVRFDGVPPAARLFVDDVPISDARENPVNLPVGSHLVRVETSSELLFSNRIEISAGEQTIHLPIERANP